MQAVNFSSLPVFRLINQFGGKNCEQELDQMALGGGTLDNGQVAGQENRSLDSVGDVFIVETLACVVQVTTMLFQGDDSSQSLDLLLSTSLTIWKKEVSKKAMGECRKSRRCSFKEMDVQDDAKDGLAEQLQCIAGRGALGTEDEQR